MTSDERSPVRCHRHRCRAALNALNDQADDELPVVCISPQFTDTEKRDSQQCSLHGLALEDARRDEDQQLVGCSVTESSLEQPLDERHTA